MPEIFSEEPQEFGEGRVWLSGSKSRPGLIHVTLLNLDGEFLCLCEGFRYSGNCRHIKEIKDMEDDAW